MNGYIVENDLPACESFKELLSQCVLPEYKLLLVFVILFSGLVQSGSLIVQRSLELTAFFLPQHPQFRDHRHAPACWNSSLFLDLDLWVWNRMEKRTRSSSRGLRLATVIQHFWAMMWRTWRTG